MSGTEPRPAGDCAAPSSRRVTSNGGTWHRIRATTAPRGGKMSRSLIRLGGRLAILAATFGVSIWNVNEYGRQWDQERRNRQIQWDAAAATSRAPDPKLVAEPPERDFQSEIIVGELVERETVTLTLGLENAPVACGSHVSRPTRQASVPNAARMSSKKPRVARQRDAPVSHGQIVAHRSQHDAGSAAHSKRLPMI